MSPPAYPPSIPKYLGEGLQKQNRDTLLDIQTYVDELLRWQTAPPEDITFDDEEEEVDVATKSNYTRVVKRVPCGKNCGGCPHGPYVYHVSREGGRLVWKYAGKV
jgi:hypothetical protein